MKKIYFIATFLLFSSIYFSCKKTTSDSEEVVSETEVSMPQSAKKVIANSSIKTTTNLLPNNLTLKKLKDSETWSAIPKNIRERVEAQQPQLLTYNNSPVKAIIFDIEAENQIYNYKSLVVYQNRDKFLSIIIESKKLQNGLNEIAFTDLEGAPYIDFLVNKENKVGKFKIHNEIPFINIKAASNIKSLNTASVQSSEDAYPPGPACVTKTKTFSECMNCQIAECSADWVCTIGCGVEFVGCMAMFAAVCAFV